jgi:NAD+ kinase
MIALFGKTLHPQNVIFVQEIIDYLTKLGLPFAIEKKYGELIKDRVNFACDTFSDFDEIRNKTEILISLGGDGTILEALTFIKNTQTPILGINFRTIRLFS